MRYSRDGPFTVQVGFERGREFLFDIGEEAFAVEDEALGVDQALIFAPACAVAANVRPILLAGDQSLFLNVIHSRRKNRLSIEVSALA